MNGLKTVLIWLALFIWGGYMFLTSFFGVGYILQNLLGWKPWFGILVINVPIYLILVGIGGFVFSDIE